MKRILLLLFLSFYIPLRLIFAAQDPIVQNDRERNFVEQTFKNFEKQRLELLAKKQGEEKRRQEMKKKRDEMRLSAQFAGLSGRLSGLPELPRFEGKFQTSRSESGD